MATTAGIRPPPDDAPTAPIVLSARGIVKRFAGVQALAGVDFELRAGEVHGLVGGNGAGKSTLIKIITGAETPDEGRVDTPSDADGRGVAAIYQELTIVPEMTAVANVFLGAPVRRGPFLARRAMVARFRELAAAIGADIDPSAIAGRLSVADQQLVEIMRAMIAEHRILIMDEPTASLGAPERRNLYRIVGELARRGTAIVYIGHDLDEVMALSDRISVMRDGNRVATRPTVDWSKDALVRSMLQELPQTSRQQNRSTERSRTLTVEGLRLPGRPPLDFHVDRGEILGIAGLVGAGRTSILHALAGVVPATTGRLTLDGKTRALPRSPREAVSLGIVLTPEDRKTQGLVLSLDGGRNLCLPNLAGLATWGIVQKDRCTRLAETSAHAVGFRQARLPARAVTLSGGNQQKLSLGKWLALKPSVLLLDEPTRGIDIGAKAEIYRTIRTLCDQGMSAILVSSELAELAETCDRVVVVAKGREIGELEGGSITVEAMMSMIFRGERQLEETKA